MIHGETVTVRYPAVVGKDDLNEDVVEWKDEVVDNVLVAPTVGQDLIAALRPDGTRSVMTLYFPKGYTRRLRGCMVVVRDYDKPFEVVGDPHPYDDRMTPGQWDQPVQVKDVEG